MLLENFYFFEVGPKNKSLPLPYYQTGTELAAALSRLLACCLAKSACLLSEIQSVTSLACSALLYRR
jgi:hypothetical protein